MEVRAVDYYRFIVTQFHVAGTRSTDDDELYLSHSVHIDGVMVASDFKHLGSFGSGTYPTQADGIQALVINDPFAKVDFLFGLVNAGNASSETVKQAILGTAQQLVGVGGGGGAGPSVSSVLAAIPGPSYVTLPLMAVGKLWDWLQANCDGPVAADHLSATRFVMDTWADDDPNGEITITNKRYYGVDSPVGCGVNSAYDVTWFVQHWRGWGEVIDDQQHALRSDVDPSAATHNGALHVFGAHNGKLVHARTFTGATWQVNELGSFGRNDVFHVNPQPASPISFNDRLYVFVVADDGSVVILTHTTDGGRWSDPPTSPPPLQTWLPPTTVVFGNRLYVFARDRTSGKLQFTSTSDFLDWRQWADVPTVGARSLTNVAVAAAVLVDRLLLFGIDETGKLPESKVVVMTATTDAVHWMPWEQVEHGARPEGGELDEQPLDVAASSFDGRVYLATRWEGPNVEPLGHYLAVNFSADAQNWSRWRVPTTTQPFVPSGAAALSAAGNHLYVLAPTGDPPSGGFAQSIWAY
jgi:hypothetical protein